MLNLPALNNTKIANAGAVLCSTSIGALGTWVSDLYSNAPPPVGAVVAAFVTMGVGALMCYLGRPSTIPPKE